MTYTVLKVTFKPNKVTYLTISAPSFLKVSFMSSVTLNSVSLYGNSDKIEAHFYHFSEYTYTHFNISIVQKVHWKFCIITLN